MSARDLTMLGLALWIVFLCACVLALVFIAERPDLRFRQFLIRRHNARRKGWIS